MATNSTLNPYPYKGHDSRIGQYHTTVGRIAAQQIKEHIAQPGTSHRTAHCTAQHRMATLVCDCTVVHTGPCLVAGQLTTTTTDIC